MPETSCRCKLYEAFVDVRLCKMTEELRRLGISHAVSERWSSLAGTTKVGRKPPAVERNFDGRMFGCQPLESPGKNIMVAG